MRPAPCDCAHSSALGPSSRPRCGPSAHRQEPPLRALPAGPGVEDPVWEVVLHRVGRCVRHTGSFRSLAASLRPWEAVRGCDAAAGAWTPWPWARHRRGTRPGHGRRNGRSRTFREPSAGSRVSRVCVRHPFSTRVCLLTPRGALPERRGGECCCASASQEPPAAAVRCPPSARFRVRLPTPPAGTAAQRWLGAAGAPVPRGHPLRLLRPGLELPLLPVFSLQTRRQQRTSH